MEQRRYGKGLHYALVMTISAGSVVHTSREAGPFSPSSTDDPVRMNKCSVRLPYSICRLCFYVSMKEHRLHRHEFWKIRRR